MKTKLKQQLASILGDRVTFNPTELIFYSHDIAAMPNLIKPLVGKTIPEAVAQPVSEQEVIDLVKWAKINRIPVTPRGSATSGYGGVLPLKGGLVIDFYRMNKIINIDQSNNTATVQPGVIWEKLDKKLASHGLTLRLYPTSYPGSGVGGWLAQGGAGIGSFESGLFSNNVVSARVVSAKGEVRQFSGKDLEIISEAEGITGLITEVTIKVMPLEEMEIAAYGFDTTDRLEKFLELAVEKKLPFWSVLFINPQMAILKNQSPAGPHGKNTEDRVELPNQYITTVAYRKKHQQEIDRYLEDILSASGGEILDQHIARHEWENRFKVMVVKRISPSLVPAEFIIPVSSLSDVLEDITSRVKKPVIKEGLLIREGRQGKPEVVILGFIPSDQRKFSYNFVFALTLTILKIAQKHGGRAYATGLYFAHKAPQIFGKQRMEKVRQYKHQTDPYGILNPHKVFGTRLINGMMKIAEFSEPAIRPVGNSVAVGIGERPHKPIKGIPADVAWYAYSCSQCGYCVPECDQFYGRGWESQSPRGRWFWLREYMEGRQKWNQHMVDSFLACTTCEICNLKCSVNLPIEPSWMKMRGKLINRDHRLTIPPFEMMAAALTKEGDIWAGYRKDRDNWFPGDLVGKHYNHQQKKKIAYFAGCTASYVEPDIAMATVRLLDEAQVEFNYVGRQENCCGTPMLVAGKWDVFAQAMKDNIEAVKKIGADTVVCSCPACDMMWRKVYPQWASKLGIKYDIKAMHYSEVIAQQIEDGKFSFPDSGKPEIKVTWHDSCHIGRASGVYDAPRKVIEAISHASLVEMEYNREQAHCCGSVLTLIKDPPIAAEVGKVRLDEAVDAGAEQILALCPCCQFQFRVTRDKKGLPIKIVDLARFAASALGYDFPDPEPEVQRQWAVFEAMIALMSPGGFAEIMKSMWPQLIDAMPFGLGIMMKKMGKIPGALKAMKPLFPVLFPRLLPRMMPKVMDTMLSRISDLVPMPDYMAEQMPDMMPRIMDNLMPHMIKEVTHLVSDSMIDYLAES
ncbi:MAG: FAD-binding and (Fe-S)-binding domain-containing protein [Actinomycetota bacterium]|nr:FAD-binding and (Fe-S)-binding domain-containing protein [Actinomycetota bacterium]